MMYQPSCLAILRYFFFLIDRVAIVLRSVCNSFSSANFDLYMQNQQSKEHRYSLMHAIPPLTGIIAIGYGNSNCTEYSGGVGVSKYLYLLTPRLIYILLCFAMQMLRIKNTTKMTSLKIAESSTKTPVEKIITIPCASLTSFCNAKNVTGSN